MKLYIVTTTREAMVWAESEVDAEKSARDIDRTEEPSIEAEEACGRRPEGWTDDALVYGTFDGDITVAKAEAMLAAEPQPDTRTIDMFADSQ